MKISKMAMAWAVAGLFAGSSAFAQQGAGGLAYPAGSYGASAQQVNYEFDNYYASSGGGSGCTSCGQAVGCDPCQSCCDPCGGCGAAAPWTLFPTLPGDINIGGWVSQSYFWNPSNPNDRFNGPVSFNDRSNEYQLNQLWLGISRDIADDNVGLDIGGRIDAVYGTDHRFTTAQGLEDSWNSQRFYGLALPQFYAEVGYNDLRVQMGHFYTIIGYEVVQATGNFFSTHAYTMQYGEPFTHTGVLARFAATESVEFLGGYHRGWDVYEGPDHGGGFLGGVTLTLGEGTALTWACTWSNENADDTGGFISQERYMQSVVLTHELSDAWLYVFQTDYGFNNNGGGLENEDWYGINQYLIWDLNDRWSWGSRFEWFRDDDGARVGGGEPNFFPRSGFAGNFWALTTGLNWRPTANIIWRNEIRYDWYSGDLGVSEIAGQGGLPFDDGNKGYQWLLGTNVIFTY